MKDLESVISEYVFESDSQKECLNEVKNIIHEQQRNLLLSFLSWQYEGIGSDLDEGEELMVDTFLEENQDN